MSNIELIKQLREEMGGIGMSDCKKALEATNYNYEEAIVWLRKKGIANAAKKTSRVAAEGLVAINIQGNNATIIEVNSETDFLARTEEFQKFVIELSNASIKAHSLEELKNENGISEKITNEIARTGEKVDLRKMEKLSVSHGTICHYVHNSMASQPMLGSIAVLVAIECAKVEERIAQLGKQIAMHIASTRPKFLNTSDVSKEEIAKEKEILTEQASTSGKPVAVIEKMVEGRMAKFYSEFVLLEQAFVMDPNISIKTLIAETAKTIGQEIKVSGFKIIKVGEGIEKVETNFAEEVAKLV